MSICIFNRATSSAKAPFFWKYSKSNKEGDTHKDEGTNSSPQVHKLNQVFSFFSEFQHLQLFLLLSGLLLLLSSLTGRALTFRESVLLLCWWLLLNNWHFNGTRVQLICFLVDRGLDSKQFEDDRYLKLLHLEAWFLWSWVVAAWRSVRIVHRFSRDDRWGLVNLWRRHHIGVGIFHFRICSHRLLFFGVVCLFLLLFGS